MAEMKVLQLIEGERRLREDATSNLRAVLREEIAELRLYVDHLQTIVDRLQEDEVLRRIEKE